MRKRILALATVVGLAVGAGAFGMQPASACEGGNDDRHPSGHGDEIAGVYVDTRVTEDERPGVYAEVQDDGEHTPVNVEAGTTHDSKTVTYTCSDAVIDFVGGELP